MPRRSHKRNAGPPREGAGASVVVIGGKPDDDIYNPPLPEAQPTADAEQFGAIPVSDFRDTRLSAAQSRAIQPQDEETTTMSKFQLLARLSAGEVLEKGAGRYHIRRDPVPKRLAERSIDEGWVDAPPDLFNLAGGRITDLGRDVLLSNGGLVHV